MGAFWFVLCMAGFSVLLGTGVTGVIYGGQARKLHMADRILVGFLTLLGVAEAAHLTMLFAGRSFAEGIAVFAAGTGVLSVFLGAVWLWRKRRAPGSRKRGSGWQGRDITPLVAGLLLVWTLLLISQIVTVWSGEHVYRAGDMTVETVQSFLQTDGLWQVNPLTGQAYEVGVPKRIQILGLPTFYGVLSRIFGLSAAETVERLIPLWVLFMSYLTYWLLAGTLFPKKQDRVGRLLFMVIVAAVFSVGDYLYGMDGFGLLYGGYRGVTIRNAVLVPYTLSLALRNRWRLVWLCMAAEVCVVWTLYGLGACAVVALGIWILWLWQRKRMESLGETGEEG
ncbi:MAG: DUF6077 domain-containing protein [Clostridium sp.]|nr:DUF6077 domain-containing protein [Acetatifactor muris]MCM1562795.1 DUF6077 domain-containing protein [Clostridium sp.]